MGRKGYPPNRYPISVNRATQRKCRQGIKCTTYGTESPSMICSFTRLIMPPK
nr:MAG TPA: hypothetical protein [Caudoviricetes sp.]